MLIAAMGLFGIAPSKSEPVEYVKVCSLYGEGFFYIPGTDTCMKIGGYTHYQEHPDPKQTYSQRSRQSIDFDTRTQTAYGVLRTYVFIYGGGGGGGTSSWNEPFPATSTGNFNVSGGTFGAQAGFWAPLGSTGARWGFGTEINATNFKGSTNVGCASPCQTSNTWYGATQLYLGYPITPAFTPYVTGGLAYGNVRADVGAFPGARDTRIGYVFGGGISTAFPGWQDARLRFEYQYLNLGTASGLCTPATCGGIADIKFSENIFRAGVQIPFQILPAIHTK